jgi:hypothetical protein
MGHSYGRSTKDRSPGRRPARRHFGLWSSTRNAGQISSLSSARSPRTVSRDSFGEQTLPPLAQCRTDRTRPGLPVRATIPAKPFGLPAAVSQGDSERQDGLPFHTWPRLSAPAIVPRREGGPSKSAEWDGASKYYDLTATDQSSTLVFPRPNGHLLA